MSSLLLQGPPRHVPRPSASITLWFGDCLTEMDKIEDSFIDLILCDLPYGVTGCKWDTLIPFDPLWHSYRRILRPTGAVVLTATQPFTSALLMSNQSWYKHSWVWAKRFAANFAVAKYQPLKVHEDILVFSPGKCPYRPQMIERDTPIKLGGNKCKSDSAKIAVAKPEYEGKTYTQKFPESIIEISCRSEKRGLHPTQKPVALMEYLIRTYTNAGDTVLDNCMGSGTTGVAALNLGRKFIGIENDSEHFKTATTRLTMEAVAA